MWVQCVPLEWQFCPGVAGEAFEKLGSLDSAGFDVFAMAGPVVALQGSKQWASCVRHGHSRIEANRFSGARACAPRIADVACARRARLRDWPRAPRPRPLRRQSASGDRNG